MKLRFGKAVRNRDGSPRIYQPGFCLAIPSVHTLKRLSVRQHTINCYNQMIMLADNLTYIFSAVIIYKIHDTDEAVYRALFEIDSVTNAVEDYTTSVLRDVVGRQTTSGIHDMGTVAELVMEQAIPKLTEWGVELLAIRFTDCAPTAATSETLLIEKQITIRAEAMAKTREKMGITDPRLLAAIVGIPVVASIDSPAEAQRGRATQANPVDDEQTPMERVVGILKKPGAP